MDSQETLIDFSLLAQQSHTGLTVFEFAVDNMNNTRIFLRGNRYLSYVVESNRDNTETNVYRVDGQAVRTRIALIERGNLLPAKITLADAAPIRLSRWLQTRTLRDFPATMAAGDINYIWKKNMVDQLRMVAEDDPATPVAWFHRSRRETVDDQQVVHPATLVITQDADDSLLFVDVDCMDTQLTLVDFDAPLPERSARTVLSFTRDSLLNSTLRISGTDSTVYVIKTNATSSRTIVSRMIPGSSEGVAEVVKIERNDILPSKITFEGALPMKTSTWLKKQTFSDPARPDDRSVQYVWKPTNGREIALYIADMPFRPIAWFRSSIPLVEPATLSLQPEAEPIQDAVIASLIVVEQKYRVLNKRGALNATRMPILLS
ncbi:hypothetical protein EIP91_004465 [Steccherinum ochraceum]|uniref:DUF6593 domain-containing protein n=1 Tax=Steccherinum ochraceum TaxID=92696 RepID=A0A4R0RHB6_9APHY|nr:hypothetical protein EIP91_004465 [Steccherinum ochraceum]